MLGDGTSTLTVELGRPAGASTPAPDPVDLTDKQALYGPTTPRLRGVEAHEKGNGLEVSADIGDEKPSEVTMDVLRDGKVVAEDLAVRDRQPAWTDTSADGDAASPCYSVRLTYTSSGNASQPASPPARQPRAAIRGGRRSRRSW